MKSSSKKKAAKKRTPTLDLQRVLAERDEARKELAEARRGRETWCHKCVELSSRVEDLEEQLRLSATTTARPSIPVTLVEAPQLAERVPAPTFGLPGDTPTTRFSREFRG